MTLGSHPAFSGSGRKSPAHTGAGKARCGQLGRAFAVSKTVRPSRACPLCPLLCFDALTNSFSPSSFLLKLIQTAGGCHPQFANSSPVSAEREAPGKGRSRGKQVSLENLFDPALQVPLHLTHELVRHRAVHHAVVVAERQIDHGADGDLLRKYHGPFLDGAYG
jgi:hypothetical protein